MNFAELRFWGLLLGSFGVVLLLRWFWLKLKPDQIEVFDKLGLLGIGLFLLFSVSHLTFIIFLVVSVGSYFGLKLILTFHPARARRYLVLLIPLQLLPLFYYKYASFVANQVIGLNLEALRHLAIPVGISFYTFQKVAFVLDTLAFNKAIPRFLDYMNFAGFFPQIVAGPIERRNQLLPQMEQFRFVWSRENINQGVAWMAVGFYFKCALADNLATFFIRAPGENACLIWVNNLLFGLRIYYDFAGYSLIALGVARCLGIRLTLNFESPYCAASMVEFWRRWHITLSQWFRDYLYLPLGGGRVPWWPANILIVFLVSGVWHGAGWNFLLWGAIHGIFLIINRLLGPKVSIPRWLGWLLTMAVSFLAWLSFYETNTGLLMAKVKIIFDPSGYSISQLRRLPEIWGPANFFVMGCFLLLAAITLILEWQSVARYKEPYLILRRPFVLICLVVLAVILAPGTNNGFIYFAF